ncbi:MAG: flippase-like domain-containing protein [Chloroflexi bacterium]|nr:flippase-like domain-containing protein [Chloroflexota bacterium]
MVSAIRSAFSLYTSAASRQARLVRFGLGIIASLGLGWLALRGLDGDLVLDALRDLPPYVVALALGIFLLSNLARAYRWRLLFLQERISVYRLFLVENMGLGLNNLLPLRIASEAAQFTILTLRDKISRGTALATLGMTRVMDIWASTLLLAVGLLIVQGAGQLARYAAGAFVFSLLLVALVRFLAWESRGFPIMGRVPLLAIFASSVAELEGRKTRLLASLALSTAQWVILGISGWLVALGMDIPLSPSQAVLVVLATIFFATSIPSLPGAIGTFEAAMIYVAGFFDVSRNQAFPYALVMHVLLFLPPTLLAAIFLPREGLGSVREFQAWVRQRDKSSSPDTVQES